MYTYITGNIIMTHPFLNKIMNSRSYESYKKSFTLKLTFQTPLYLIPRESFKSTALSNEGPIELSIVKAFIQAIT